MQSICILGRQPKLAIAELESLYGANSVTEITTSAALLSISPEDIAFDRLGGTIKLAKVLEIIETTNWGEIEKFILNYLPKKTKELAGGKLTIGLSAYGLKINSKQVSRLALSLKKEIRTQGRSVRIVPNKDLTLGSAQVIYNKLTGPNGWEIVLISDGQKTFIAQTTREQNINSYSLRDRDRPKRDSRVGMLPPKLAQIIINLATGDRKDGLLLDPFCGTGVILQEALLMGYPAEGSDLDQRMVDYSAANLLWLEHNFKKQKEKYHLEVGDATSFVWGREPQFIATEAYLGQAFTTQPTDAEIAQNVSNTNLIIKKSLQNIAKQMPSGTRICLAVPAYHTPGGNFRHLPFIDSVEELGYNRVRFEHLSNSDLLYYRENQVVARELLVIIRK